MAFKINDQLLTFIEEIRSEKSPEKGQEPPKEQFIPITRQKGYRDLPAHFARAQEERVKTVYLMAKETTPEKGKQ